MSDIGIIADTESEFHRGWTVVLACFCTATFAWGFGFYGQSVYLAVLHETRGQPSALIASAAIVGYLASAIWTMHVHRAIRVLGLRLLQLAGAAILGASAVGMSRSQTLWQLYLWNIVLSIGWAILLPIILLGVGPTPPQGVKRTSALRHATASPLSAPSSAAQALRSVRFWSAS
jgi:hypothetical protein